MKCTSNRVLSVLIVSLTLSLFIYGRIWFIRNRSDKKLALTRREIESVFKTKRCLQEVTNEEDLVCVDVYPYAFQPQINERVVTFGKHPHVPKSILESTKIVAEICTVASSNRIFRIMDMVRDEIPAILRTFPEARMYLSVAFYTQDFEEDYLALKEKVMMNPDVCKDDWCEEFLHIHFVYKKEFRPFSLNMNRNVAMKYSIAPWIMLYDIDFIPSSGILKDLYETASSFLKYTDKIFIAPAFEFNYTATHSDCKNEVMRSKYGIECSAAVPKTKLDMITAKKHHLVSVFHAVYYQGHRSTDYERWWRSTQPHETYTAVYERGYEPYFFIHRELLTKEGPWGVEYCDERMLFGNYDKIICFDRIKLAVQPQTYVLVNSYVIHYFEGIVGRGFGWVEPDNSLYNKAWLELYDNYHPKGEYIDKTAVWLKSKVRTDT